MKKTLAALLSALTLSIATACGAGAASAAGVYELDRAALKESMLGQLTPEEKANKEALNMMDNFLPTITMDLKADGTVAVSAKAMGQDHPSTGTWKLEGTKLIMKTKEKDGSEDTKTAEYTNGSFSIEAEEMGRKMKMTFKKK